MLGTIINAVTIVICSLIGLVFSKTISKNFEDSIIKTVGLAVVTISIIGIVSNSINIVNGSLKSSFEIELLICLVIGSLIGEILKLDHHANSIGSKLEKRFKLGNFSKGFVMASVMFCSGAMAIFGPINEVVNSDMSILITKSILDGIVSIIFASAMGIGVLFSSVAVFVYQGIFVLFASVLLPIITDDMMSLISLIGYAIILTIGLNQMKITNIKTANLVPALFLPIIYYLVIYYLA